jgi:hypothetical protein
MNPLRSFLSAAVAVAILPTAAFACSPAPGVDTHAFLQSIALAGRLPWGVSVLAAVAWAISGRQPRGRRTLVLVMLAAASPGWWAWGIGDCGAFAFLSGSVVALLSLIVLGQGFWRRGLHKADIQMPGV